MRNGVHVDLCEHHAAEIAALENLLEHAHGLVVAHVLVHRQQFAGGVRRVAQRDGVRQRERQRLLGQDALDVRLAQRVSNERRLLIRRKRDVEDLDRRILDQRRRALVHLWYAPALSHGRRVVLAAGGNRNHREPRVLVRGQVALGHDHARADTADGHIAAANGSVWDEAHGVGHVLCRSMSASVVSSQAR